MITATRKQKEIFHVLAEYAKANNLSAGDHLPSIRTMAAETGIAHATVARAIRILAEKGFLECQSRSGILLKKAITDSTESGMLRLINVCFTDSSNSTSYSTGEGAFLFRQGVKAHMPDAEISTVWFSGKDPASSIERMLYYHYQLRGKTNNTVFILNSCPEWAKRVFQDKEIPAIIIGGREPGITLPNVTTDTAVVLQQVARALTQAAAFPAAFLVDSEQIIGNQNDYVEGFSKIPGVSSRRVSTSLDVFRGQLTDMLQHGNPPRTLILQSDEVGLRTLKVLSELGVKVPNEVGVLVIDSSSLCEQVTPTLTGFHKDFSFFAEAFADLLRKLRAGDDLRGISIVTTSVLVFRESFPNPYASSGGVLSRAGRREEGFSSWPSAK